MFGIELLAKLLKILKSGASPAQIAWGFSFGMVIGLTPFLSLHNFILILLIIIFNINIASVLFSFFVFSLLGIALDPLFHLLGYSLLVDSAGLKSFWTFLYNMPVIGASRFNNTVVMGSLIISIVLILPLFFSIQKFVVGYRTNLSTKIRKSGEFDK